ncbi:GGDEF domain-containing phosphodiesterase [Marinobacterium stanieri]|uniref:GGDEF domain-containing phosphodiesterase n=1 Tax=Marinobacterium stanieri TaxID=49186 RepID=UPI0011128D85|nr:GGDEF domain-containing phosphodiesterase [Marinobacterium stanieri]
MKEYTVRQRPYKLLEYVALYVAFGLLWIHGSDSLVAYLTGENTDLFATISRVKGSLFIVVTALFFYFALLRTSKSGQASPETGRFDLPILLSGLLLVLSAPLLGGPLSHFLADTLLVPHWVGLLLAGVVAAGIVLFLLAVYRQKLASRFDEHLSQEVSRREDLMTHFFELPFVGMALADPNTGRWIRVNEQLLHMLGYSADQLYALSWQELTHPDDLADDEGIFAQLMAGEIDCYQLEKRFMSASGDAIPVRISVRLINTREGVPEFIVGMVQDLTQEHHQQRLLRRETSLYNMLSQINQLILYSRSEQEVLQSACDIAVTLDSLTFAWVGSCNEQRHLQTVLAHAGKSNVDQGFDDLFALFQRHPGRGLSEKALVEERTVVENDSLNSPDYAPWLDFTKRFQCRSAIALPIRKNGRIFANLTLYSGETAFFGERLVQTLEEMASDIGFALDSIQRDKALEVANQVINSSPFVLVRWDNAPGWPVRFVSDNIRRWGVSPEDILHDSNVFEELIHPEDRERIAAEVASHLDHGALEYSQLYRMVLPDQQVHWVDDHTHIITNEDGDVVGFEGVLVDVTERQMQESRLRQAAAVVNSTREGVIITDAHQRIVQVNPAFTEMFDWTEADLLNQTPSVLRSGLHAPNFYAEILRTLESEGHWQGEIISRRKGGDSFPALLSISQVKDSQGDITHYVGVYTDLTRLKKNESQIEFLSNYDSLTELPNRHLLFSRLGNCIQYNRRHKRRSALLMADLDNFKDINDSLGHLEGDKLLVQVVQRFKTRIREEDSLFRLGGDEFAVLLEDIGGSEQAAAVADDLMRQLDTGFILGDGVEVRSSVSLGISMVDGSTDSPAEVLQQADAALFKAKEQRGSLSFFSDDLTSSARRRLDMERRLRYALEHGELSLYYQPQWDIETGAMTGLEALIRWQDPEEGLISPADFIPVAEQSNLIGSIGRWVVLEACRQLADWRGRGIITPRVAINVSAQQLLYHDLVEIVAGALDETGIPPRLLEVELTEGVLMSAAVSPEKMLHELRQLGVRMAIDDFGTGYSSLAYLKRFPIDVLKIDKSFTDDLLTSREASAVVETIIVLGHKLGLTVLAEGVETSDQLQELERLGCHQFQGYLRSKPLPVNELEDFLISNEC